LVETYKIIKGKPTNKLRKKPAKIAPIISPISISFEEFNYRKAIVVYER